MYRDYYAETQDRQGNYEATDITLGRCWEIELGDDVDDNIIRELGTAEEVDQLRNAILKATDEELETEIDRITAQIEQRVMAAGEWTLDGKTTRYIRETVQMIKRNPYEEQGLVEYAGEPERLEDWQGELDKYDVEIVSTCVKGWEDYEATVKLTRGDDVLYYLIGGQARKNL